MIGLMYLLIASSLGSRDDRKIATRLANYLIDAYSSVTLTIVTNSMRMVLFTHFTFLNKIC